MLRQPAFVLMLSACELIQGSHAVYYAFGTIHWRSIGYSEDVIGALWAEGVICEVALFAFGATVIRRFGAGRLIILAGLAAGVAGSAPVSPTRCRQLSFSRRCTASASARRISARCTGSAAGVSPGMAAGDLYSAAVFGLFLAGMLYGAKLALSDARWRGICADGSGRADWRWIGLALASRGKTRPITDRFAVAHLIETAAAHAGIELLAKEDRMYKTKAAERMPSSGQHRPRSATWRSGPSARYRNCDRGNQDTSRTSSQAKAREGSSRFYFSDHHDEGRQTWLFLMVSPISCCTARHEWVWISAKPFSWSSAHASHPS